MSNMATEYNKAGNQVPNFSLDARYRATLYLSDAEKESILKINDYNEKRSEFINMKFNLYLVF